MQYVFLSHDVDWSLQGPGRDHILARRDRFDQETIRNIDTVNPYNNINDYITIEEKFGVDLHSSLGLITRMVDALIMKIIFRPYQEAGGK